MLTRKIVNEFMPPAAGITDILYNTYQIYISKLHFMPYIHTVKRPILKSSLLRQMAPLEYINTLFKKSIPKKPR
jgi:hypothetical protein